MFTSGPQTITLSTVGDNTFGGSAFGITSTIAIVGPTGSNGLTWSFSSRLGQDAVLTSVNRPYPLPAVVSSALVSRARPR